MKGKPLNFRISNGFIPGCGNRIFKNLTVYSFVSYHKYGNVSFQRLSRLFRVLSLQVAIKKSIRYLDILMLSVLFLNRDYFIFITLRNAHFFLKMVKRGNGSYLPSKQGKNLFS